MYQMLKVKHLTITGEILLINLMAATRLINIGTGLRCINSSFNNICRWRNIWTAGRSVQQPDSSTTKPC